MSETLQGASLKFFLPIQNQADAEKMYAAIRRFVAEQMGPLDERRFYRLTFRHHSREIVANVGEPDPLEGGLVFAIFRSASETGSFYICTENRGVLRGEPILAGPPGSAAVEFD